MRVLVVGGGAAGYFGAITCAETARDAQVVLCEATTHPLAKVRISGGGRCNVTHACFDPATLVKNYPRGARELLGPLHRWQPRDTVEWFSARGVELKTEADGRMFPITDDSATIVDCLMSEAAKAGVEVRLSLGVIKLERGFKATFTDGTSAAFDRVLLATGGNKSSAGLAIAGAFGHAIEPPVPSLFTFHVKDPRLEGLAGVSVGDVEATAKVRLVQDTSPTVSRTTVGSVSCTDRSLRARGPLLVTHWGLSGPAILRLSAWGARPLAACGYAFSVQVNFAPDLSPAELAQTLAAARTDHARKQVASWCPVAMPVRLWERLIAAAGIPAAHKWAEVNNARLSALGSQLSASAFRVTGKSMNKEEFVTCGGVRLSEVNFKTMESRLVPGLHFAGEVLDIDGLTGGFNFQSAWTTSRLAGEAMAATVTGNG